MIWVLFFVGRVLGDLEDCDVSTSVDLDAFTQGTLGMDDTIAYECSDTAEGDLLSFQIYAEHDPADKFKVGFAENAQDCEDKKFVDDFSCWPGDADEDGIQDESFCGKYDVPISGDYVCIFVLCSNTANDCTLEVEISYMANPGEIVWNEEEPVYPPLSCGTLNEEGAQQAHNLELDQNGGSHRWYCSPHGGLRPGVILTFEVQSTSSIPLTSDDMLIFHAYGDACNMPLQRIQQDDLYETSDSCGNVAVDLCLKNDIKIEAAGIDGDCIIVQCKNLVNNCDLYIRVEYGQEIDSVAGQEICKYDRTIEVDPLFYEQYEVFECSDSWTDVFSDDLTLQKDDLLNYHIRVLNNDDSIKVFHASGENCGKDPGDADFMHDEATSCAGSGVTECKETDVLVPGDRDCVFIWCENEFENCDVDLEIVWTRPAGVSGSSGLSLSFGLIFAVFSIW